ncbi:MAG: IS4 family transposase [Zavarzinella sp.]|nr:IS4 family transposase [Zavarzinella sp.]
MDMVSRAGRAIQQLFGPLVEAAAATSGVIQRQRSLTASSLARTFVLGFLRKPRATDEDLAQMAAVCRTPVTPQAIEQRHTPRLVAFLGTLFRGAARVVVGSDRAVAAILERFPAVTVLDSSTIPLPEGQAKTYAGCGGSYGGGQAALKLQTELDLRSGALAHVEVEPGRRTDSATCRQHVRRGPGSLRITDLGYFCLAVFAAMTRAGEHFLSRLPFGTHVFPWDDAFVELLPWLAAHGGPFVDARVLLGKSERLACRLIAWRVPEEQADRRRQKLRETHRRKWGRDPSTDRLAWCDWTILVTSVPESRLTPREAVVLYRARWQVELLFKRWKSQGLIAELTGSTEVRQMVRLWARLLAVLVQHWLVAASGGGNPQMSWDKAYEAVRGFAGALLAAWDRPLDLAVLLADLARVLAKTCRQNQRRRPSNNNLLNDAQRLDYRLT